MNWFLEGLMLKSASQSSLNICADLPATKNFEVTSLLRYENCRREIRQLCTESKKSLYVNLKSHCKKCEYLHENIYVAACGWRQITNRKP